MHSLGFHLHPLSQWVLLTTNVGIQEKPKQYYTTLICRMMSVQAKWLQGKMLIKQFSYKRQRGSRATCSSAADTDSPWETVKCCCIPPQTGGHTRTHKQMCVPINCNKMPRKAGDVRRDKRDMALRLQSEHAVTSRLLSAAAFALGQLSLLCNYGVGVGWRGCAALLVATVHWQEVFAVIAREDCGNKRQLSASAACDSVPTGLLGSETPPPPPPLLEIVENERRKWHRGRKRLWWKNPARIEKWIKHVAEWTVLMWRLTFCNDFVFPRWNSSFHDFHLFFEKRHPWF